MAPPCSPPRRRGHPRPLIAAAYLVFAGTACATGRSLGPAGPPRPPATLGGRVVDATDGRPVADAIVSAVHTASGDRQTRRTDQEGRYEFSALPAGAYLLSAEAPGYVPQQFGQRGWLPEGMPLDVAPGAALREVNFRLQRDAVVTGRIRDPAGNPAPGVVVEALRLSAREPRRGLVALGRTASQADGTYRLAGLPPGDYFIAATLLPSASAELPTYAPTYYPGVASIGQARRVTLAPDGEASGIDFPLHLVRRARVSGRLVAPGDQRLRAGAVVLSPAVEELGAFAGELSAQLQPDGHFAFTGVPPGRYVLVARAETDTPGPPLFGTFHLTVEGRDLAELDLALRPGVPVAGEVVFEDSSPPPAALVARIAVRAPAVEEGASGTDAPGFVRPDGTFEAYALPGTRRVQVEGVPEPWVLRAVYYQGRDITDRPVVLGEGRPVSGVRVVLTTRAAVLTGRVHNPDGRPLVGYTVLVAPDDPALWFAGSRRIRLVPIDSDGRYRIRDLPPGFYLVTLVAGFDESDLFLSGVLLRVASRARRVQLKAGDTAVVDLSLAADALTAHRIGVAPDRVVASSPVPRRMPAALPPLLIR